MKIHKHVFVLHVMQIHYLYCTYSTIGFCDHQLKYDTFPYYNLSGVIPKIGA